MSLGTPKPNSMLSRLEVAGNPRHGVVDAGTLTLPNGDTVSHPAPTGVAYMSGRSIDVARPGWAGPTRTPEQQTADTAAGYQWLNYGILAGESAMLYGTQLGEMKWIYIDPNGTRWLAELILLSAISTLQGQATTVRLVRFGEYGVAVESHDYAVTVPDLEQATPEWAGFGTSGEWSLRLMDALPNGSGSLWMCAITNANVGQGVGGAIQTGVLQDMALAFVEILISGAGSAATAVMHLRRNRAQCVGAVVNEPYPKFQNPIGALESGVTPYRAAVLSVQNTGSTSYNGQECTGGSSYSATVRYFLSDPGGGLPSQPPEETWNGFASIYELTATVNFSRTDVILSGFYDASGLIKYITLDVALQWVIDNQPAVITTGPTVETVTAASGSPGACSNAIQSEDVGSISYSKSNAVTGTSTVTIKRDGVVCSTATHSGTRQIHYTETLEYKAALAGAPALRGQRTRTATDTYNNAAPRVSVTNQSTQGFPDFYIGNTALWAGPSLDPSIIYPWHQRRDTTATADTLSAVDLIPWPVFGNHSSSQHLGEPVLPPGRVAVQPARLGPAIATLIESLQVEAGGGNFTATYHPQHAAPGGAVTMPALAVDTGGFDTTFPTIPLRATAHPVTGEVARSFDPVCWV